MRLLCHKNKNPDPAATRRGLVLGWVLVLWFAARPLFGATFTASLDRDTVMLGDSVTLSLIVEGGEPRTVPAIPGIAGLKVAYLGPSSQTRVNIGPQGSQIVRTVSHTFQVMPLEPGEFTIPALQAEVDGQTLTSQPLKVKAFRASAPPPNVATNEPQLAFARLIIPGKEIYVGEVVPIQVEVYLHSAVQRIEAFQVLPVSSEGVTVGQPVELQNKQARIGNTLYRVVPLMMTLSAVKTGPLKVGPIDAVAVLHLPASPNPRRRDPLNDLLNLDAFFQRTEARRVTISTEAETLHALTLPTESVPANFKGAVGNYSLNVSAAPTNVAVGDPITVKIHISGRGAIETLTLPEQTAWRGFRSYPPTAKVDTTDALGLQGTKAFEVVVTPESADIRELPPVSFSFFDPEQQGYRTLASAAVPLVVRPAGTLPTPTIVSAAASDDLAPAQDIVPIKVRLGHLAQIQSPLVERPWFLALQGVPVLAWVTLLVRRKRAEALANNPRIRRQRQVAQIIRTGLEDLRRLAEANRSEDFFATVFRLLQEQLGERLDSPASAITEAVVDERLRPRGVPEQTLKSLHELFQMCNQARYAPEHTHQELVSLTAKVETALREVQKIKA